MVSGEEGQAYGLELLRARPRLPAEAPAAMQGLARELDALSLRMTCGAGSVFPPGPPVACAPHFPDAAAELDAATRHIATAVGTILDCCEALEAESAAAGCGPLVATAMTRIFELCGFQDIVGQRLARVAQALAAMSTAEPAPAPLDNAVVHGGAALDEKVLAGPLSRLDQSGVDALMGATA